MRRYTPRPQPTPADLRVELERLLRQRALFDRARADPNFRLYKPVRTHRLRVSEEMVLAAELNFAGLDFAAQLIGDDALGLIQPRVDVDVLRSKSPELRALVDRFRPLLPHRTHDAAKHRIVAVLWLRWKLPRYLYKKSATWEVADAYGRVAETIRGWDVKYRKAALELAPDLNSLDPRHFYELVFRRGAGARSLGECGKAFKDWLNATTQVRISGRPAKKSP